MEVMQGMFEAEGIDLNEVLSMSLVDQVTEETISFIIATITIVNITTITIVSILLPFVTIIIITSVIFANISIIITMLIRLVLFLVCLSFKILTLLKNKQEKVLQGDSCC